MIKRYLKYVNKEIDPHSSKCDNFFLLGVFNSEPTEEVMKSFCQIYNFKNLLDKPTCYKTPHQSLVCGFDHNKQAQKLPKLLHLRSRALRLPQNDHNSTKIIFCKKETKSTKLPQLQILQQYSF